MNKFTQLYTQLLLEFSEPIIQKLIVKFSEVDEQTVRFYLDEFEKYKTELDKKDPFQYSSFEELLKVIKKIKGDKSRNKSNIKIDVDQGDIIAEDDNVVIYKGDSQDKCILYGQGYNFCISRRAAGNMYSSYRGNDESTFYFIYFKNKPKSSNDHIMVLDHYRDGYQWTFADNNTEKVKGGWDEIVKNYPTLKPYKDIIINKKLDDAEQSELDNIEYFLDNPTVDKFIEFDFDQRSRILKSRINLNDEIFNILSKDLLNEFLSIGPNLTPSQTSSLNDKQKSWYLRNRKIELNEYISSKIYKFNELDIGIEEIKNNLQKDYNEAFLRCEGGNYDLSNLLFLVKLPTNIPDVIKNDFNCSNTSLLSLQGSPVSVVGNFSCINAQLTSLKGGPRRVRGDFYCGGNNLHSLKGSPQQVNGSFNCVNCNLTSLEGELHSVYQDFNCHNNGLTSLKGGPTTVGGNYFCNRNNLTSLEGSPYVIKGEFVCRLNNLTSLKGAPAVAVNGFYCNPQKNGAIFTEDEIKEAMEDRRAYPIKENRKFTQLELLENLRDWFAPQVDKKGKKFRGWVNCKTGGPCGRNDTSKGSYPACRATKAECNKIKGRMYKKKSSKRVSWKKGKKKSE